MKIMRCLKLLAIFSIIVIISACGADKEDAQNSSNTATMSLEKSTWGSTEIPNDAKEFSDKEIETFELIKSYYENFRYSDTYVVTGNGYKKMVFERTNNLIFGVYISYSVVYSYNAVGVINYTFDAGSAYRGYGAYYVIDNNTVIKIQKSSGTGAYGYEIFKNGVKIDEERKKSKDNALYKVLYC